jgi:hypothetical protein
MSVAKPEDYLKDELSSVSATSNTVVPNVTLRTDLE